MRAVFLAATLVAALALATGAASRSLAAPHAQDDATIHRRFDDAAYWSKVFDDPARDFWQRPDDVVAALALAPGMTVADIGAGTGYFAKRLSTAVGPLGTVFAVEVEPSLVAHLRDRADREKTPNVVPVLASTDNPRLPAASLDVALFVDTWHHIDRRREYLATLGRSLKPSARLAVVEWKPGPRPFGPKEEDHKIPREKVEREMSAAGFEALPSPDLLPHQYVALFRRAEPARPSR